MSYPIGALPTLYQGIVEDRNDPLEVGRVRVRVYGIHSPNLADVPTSSLPWATVAQSTEGGGNFGLGWAPTGIVPGTMVFCYFADGEEFQVPVVTGIAPGMNDIVGAYTSDTMAPASSQTANAATNSTLTGNNTNSNSSGWVLGQTSEKYETGGNGVATISSGWLNRAAGVKDPGGKSYGPWQLASIYTTREGVEKTTGTTLESYVKKSKFYSKLSAYPLASDGFDYAWKAVCNSDGQAFKQDQYEFILRTHYNPEMSSLSSLGLDTRSEGVQDCIWSMAVQHRANTRRWVAEALSGKNLAELTDADVVTLVMNDRMQRVPSQRSRYTRELSDLLALCPDKVTAASATPATPTGKDAYGNPVYATPPNSQRAATPSGKAFTDPTGRQPRSAYKGKVDTNALAKGGSSSVVQRKKSTITADGVTEPPSPFAPKYPFNHVYESESGHVIEIDDTPGAERLHTYHRSGSFVEHHPDGTVVFKSVKDEYEIVMGNLGVYVKGNVNVVVDGNVNYVIAGNAKIQTSGNLSMISKGNMELLCEGAFKAGSVGEATLVSSAQINLAAPLVSENASGDLQLDFSTVVSSATAPGAAPVDVMDESATGSKGITNASQVPYAIPKDPSASTTPRDIKETKATIDPSKLGSKFSKNYTIEEVTTSVTFPCALQDQAGLTADAIYNNLQFLARNVLDPIADRFGKSTFIITNALRVANGSHSHHVQGAAADIQFPGVKVSEYPHIAEKIRQLLPAWSQLILEYHAISPVIHVAYSAGDSATPLSKANGDIKVCFTTFTPDFAPWRVDGNGFYSKNQELIYKV